MEDALLKIHEALSQISELRGVVLDKRYFTGYSGKSKIVGGCLALLTSFLLAMEYIPQNDGAHLLAWLLLGAAGMAVNYSAIFRWYSELNVEEKRLARIIPVVDACPSILVGMILSWGLIAHGALDLLFGTWMSLYGLAHMTYRILLPKPYYWVGVFYLLSGSLLLLFPQPFLEPWFMGIVFFTGEIAGGIILERNKQVNK
jgi:uncharacterized membrane protein